MKMAKAPEGEAETLLHWLQEQENEGVNVPAWRRVVFGYTVLVDNCCDPTKTYLDWKPELLTLQEDKERLEKELAVAKKTLKEQERITKSLAIAESVLTELASLGGRNSDGNVLAQDALNVIATIKKEEVK